MDPEKTKSPSHCVAARIAHHMEEDIDAVAMTKDTAAQTAISLELLAFLSVAGCKSNSNQPSTQNASNAAQPVDQNDPASANLAPVSNGDQTADPNAAAAQPQARVSGTVPEIRRHRRRSDNGGDQPDIYPTDNSKIRVITNGTTTIKITMKAMTRTTRLVPSNMPKILRLHCRNTNSLPALAMDTSGRLVIGLMGRTVISGHQERGHSRPSPVPCGRRGIGASTKQDISPNG